MAAHMSAVWPCQFSVGVDAAAVLEQRLHACDVAGACGGHQHGLAFAEGRVGVAAGIEHGSSISALRTIAASCSGVKPKRFARLGSAPSLSSRSTAPRSLRCAAQWSADADVSAEVAARTRRRQRERRHAMAESGAFHAAPRARARRARRCRCSRTCPCRSSRSRCRRAAAR